MQNSYNYQVQPIWSRSAFILSRVVLALVLALFCSRALGQSGAGSIQGTVTDSTGAAIPGALVHVVNQATGVTFDSKSNSAGFYQLPDLFTGEYELTVSTPGMNSYKTTIELLVSQNAVINPVLSPGTVTQQVTVSSNPVQLTTKDDGAITETLENTRINQLPMNGRSLLTLTQETTPGLEDGGQEINGLSPQALEYVVDGTTTTQLLNGGEHNTFTQLVDPDAVQEVRMELNGSSAQFALPGTAIITTKSGTNQIHGTAFETARNNAWGIAKDRQDPAAYAAPHYIRNEFGASAGGPVILPRFYDGKNKTFWFFAYERYSLATNSPVESSVPTPAMRQGNFSGLTNSAGVAQTLYDPSTTYNATKCAATGGANAYCRTPFPNNQIPVSEESPTAALVYQLIPQPTSTANPEVSPNLNLLDPTYQVVQQVSVRLDQTFTEKNRAFLSFSQNINAVDSVGSLENLAADGIPVGAAQGYTNSPTWSHLASIGYTHIFSPTFFSETVASQQWFNTTYDPGTAIHNDYEKTLNLPNNFGEIGFPDIGGGGLIDSLTGSQAYDASVQIISNLDENLTKTLGSHQLQFGGRFRHIRVSDQPQGTPDTISVTAQPTGIYNPASGANYTNLANAGFADASFFIGSGSNYTTNLEPPDAHYHMNELDSYFEDNYHVSKTLTLNMGLRYEAHPALWMKYGLANGFDLKNDALVLAAPPSTLIAEGYTTQAVITNDENIGVKFETPAQAGVPGTTERSSDLNFLPRFGFAYQPFQGRSGTVIRGAYGRYAYPEPFSQYTNQADRNNPLAASYAQSYTAANQAIDGLPDELLRYNDPAVFGVMGVNTANVVNSTTTNAILPGVTVSNVNSDFPPSFATEANVTIEQALKGNSALRVSWVFTHGSNLLVIDSYNNHPSTFQYEMATGNVAPTGGASVIGTPLQNTYAATATGPYDQTTWGANTLRNKTGWSNDNALQVDYQRLFHHGIAYQISYVYSKALTNEGMTAYPDANYPGILGAIGTMSSPYGPIGYAGTPPPVRPADLADWADWHEMDRYQGYKLNSAVPKMHVNFNGVVDLPFGRGKHFFGNASRWVDELIGGFQIAGSGQVISQVFQLSTGNFGLTNPIHVYKHKLPISDCRSGVCYKGYQWFNGDLAPTVTTACASNCITGLPGTFTPFQTPIDNTPGTTYYGTNDVLVTLANGKQTVVAYDAGPEGAAYLAKQFLNGPNNWKADLSLFKVFPIKDRLTLRVNLDAFNAFNIQGYNNPGGLGVEDVQPGLGDASSYWSPRQIQITARLSF